jgi:hypothetical protein
MIRFLVATNKNVKKRTPRVSAFKFEKTSKQQDLPCQPFEMFFEETKVLHLDLFLLCEAQLDFVFRQLSCYYSLLYYEMKPKNLK